MSPLLVASLLTNIAVLVPVTGGILLEAAWVKRAFGPREPARQILLAIYLAILVLSGSLLVWGDVRMATGLLLVQVLYKVLSPVTVGTLRNPVVISNLAIAGLHAVTLSTLRA
jgi:hypothetical protein